MRLHEALHQILTHGGAFDMRLATYRSDSRPYFFFRKLVDAHVFDSCPAMGSAVRLMVEEGDAIILWNCGTGSSWRDRNGYLGALEQARKLLLGRFSPDLAGYVLDSFAFACGPGYSEEAYSDLNRRWEMILASRSSPAEAEAGSMFGGRGRKDDAGPWRRLLIALRVMDFIMFAVFRVMVPLGLIVLFLWSLCVLR